MTKASVIGTHKRISAKLISSVITTCTQRKRLKAIATPSALARGEQSTVNRSWLDTLAMVEVTTAARDLYAGRAFALAAQAAQLSESPLYVISAGLGLVSGDKKAPAYGLTVSKGHIDSIATKVTGPFEAAAWFADLLGGPYSTSWTDIARSGEGRILIALTRPYAGLISDSLSNLAPEIIVRLRIFGAGLTSVLPMTLRSAVVPYDERLDSILPGTRSDFAQRAMLHFVQHFAHLAVDRDSDAAAVTAAMSDLKACPRPTRARRTDDEILALIRSRLSPAASASRLLRRLRDDDGVACEQGRFARLFRSAIARKADL